MLVDRQMQSEITPVTAQVDFEVDCPPPADSPPGDLLITMVKEMVNLFLLGVTCALAPGTWRSTAL